MTQIFTMQAEWEPHEATWLAWPHNKEHWPGNFDLIPHTYGEIVRALAKSEKVFICVNDEEMEKSAREIIGAGRRGTPENVFYYRIPTDASWSRDHGPIFVRGGDGKLTIINWIFNAWGGKYPPWDNDDAVPARIAEIF